MSTQLLVLLPLAVNSKSEWKVGSLPPLGLEPATFGTQAHLSDRSAEPAFFFTMPSYGKVFFSSFFYFTFLSCVYAEKEEEKNDTHLEKCAD
jgi:hypothetical protein